MSDGPRLVSVRVGTPQPIDGDRPSTTAFFKRTVEGSVWLRSTNLDGDSQADLSVHGGPDKAVCVYPASNYAHWAHEFGRDVGGPGWFGENFTVSDQDETSVCIGDIYRVGTAIVQVAQPRGPCWKLAYRWQQPDLPRRVVATGLSGWYLRVLKEGQVSADCPVALESRSWPRWTIARVNTLTFAKGSGRPGNELRALSQCADLADSWKAMLTRE